VNLTDAILHGFAKGDHGGTPGEAIATVDPILFKTPSPLVTPAVMDALGQEPPPTIEQRVAALERRVAELEQQE